MNTEELLAHMKKRSEQEARVRQIRDEEMSKSKINGFNDYVVFSLHTICLDGNFSVQELECIVRIMKRIKEEV